jgi:hypothetical protein
VSSAYVLELSARPGGARWAETHTWTEPWQLRMLLDEFCANDDNLAAYHCLAAAATLGIWVVQQGELTRFIDLQPFIFVKQPEGARSLAELFADPETLNALLDAHDDEWLEDVELELFWDAIEDQLPALVAPVLQPDEQAPVELVFPPGAPKDSYLSFATPLTLGSVEHESGEELEPPFELPS